MVPADVQLSPPGSCTERFFYQDDPRPAAVPAAQEAHTLRLWFNSDYARPQTGPDPDPVTDMCANVKAQIARLDELAVETGHTEQLMRLPVIDQDGAQQARRDQRTGLIYG